MRGPRYDSPLPAPRGPDYDKSGGALRKADWKGHEKEVARRSGSRQVSGSGNQPGRPGDVTDSIYLREAKATRGSSLTISPRWMKKLVQEALRMGRTPVFEVRLEGAPLPIPTDWILIPAADFPGAL